MLFPFAQCLNTRDVQEVWPFIVSTAPPIRIYLAVIERLHSWVIVASRPPAAISAWVASATGPPQGGLWAALAYPS
eukprot:2345112-Pyramimonas_sp.AAC.1